MMFQQAYANTVNAVPHAAYTNASNGYNHQQATLNLQAPPPPPQATIALLLNLQAPPPPPPPPGSTTIGTSTTLQNDTLSGTTTTTNSTLQNGLYDNTTTSGTDYDGGCTDCVISGSDLILLI